MCQKKKKGPEVGISSGLAVSGSCFSFLTVTLKNQNASTLSTSLHSALPRLKVVKPLFPIVWPIVWAICPPWYPDTFCCSNTAKFLTPLHPRYSTVYAVCQDKPRNGWKHFSSCSSLYHLDVLIFSGGTFFLMHRDTLFFCLTFCQTKE